MITVLSFTTTTRISEGVQADIGGPFTFILSLFTSHTHSMPPLLATLIATDTTLCSLSRSSSAHIYTILPIAIEPRIGRTPLSFCLHLMNLATPMEVSWCCIISMFASMILQIEPCVTTTINDGRLPSWHIILPIQWPIKGWYLGIRSTNVWSKTIKLRNWEATGPLQDYVFPLLFLLD